MSRERLPNRRPSESLEFERDGLKIKMTVSYTPSGDVGEVFLNGTPLDSMIDALLGDAAIAISLALQFGCPLSTIAHAVRRDRFGIASSPIGAALDRINAPMVLK